MHKIVMGMIVVCWAMQMHAGSEFKRVSAGNGVVRCGAGPALKKRADQQQDIEMEVIHRAEVAAPDPDKKPKGLFFADVGRASRRIVAARTASQESRSAYDEILAARQFPVIFGKPTW